MRLKKIAILGFKSFADKTVLQFDSGITCIVGPNGCGKSNIADAFRWVLGEQSAKSMRGAKMPDVIFAGASQRKPLNYAEVSLTLTDVQESLPIDYEEITITRRLHRSGESEYLLNGNPVRLKDLQTLFLGSGVGRNAFSIFEQGKLDQVINYSPLERRYIFEEASGILRFLQSKKESLKRLEQSDLNLSRVRDIHLEVEKQIQLLQGQAEKAHVFKEQKKELELLEKACYVLRWQAIDKKRSDFQTKQNKQMKELEERKILFAACQSKCQEAAELRRQYEKNLRQESEQLLTLRGEQEVQKRECQSLGQRLNEILQREKKLRIELEELALSRKMRREGMSELGKKRGQLDSDWSDAEAKWNHQQGRVKELEGEVKRLRQGATEKQQGHLKCFQDSSQLQSELKQAEVRLENLVEHKKQVEIRRQQLKVDSQQLLEGVQEKRQSLKKLSELVDTHKDRLDQFEEELKKLALQGEEIEKELEALRRKMMECKARQKVLVRMREEFEGFSSGSKRLLQESQKEGGLFYQKLRPFYEYFTADAESTEILAVALRAYSQTLVVEKEEDLKSILDFAQREGLQDYSLFCIEWIEDSSRPSLLLEASLARKVSSNPVSSHFLESIATADSIEEVRTVCQKGKYVEGWSNEGVFFDHRGVLFMVKAGENQVFIRESELKNLEEEVARKEELLAKSEQALRHLQHRRSHLQVERGEVDKILRRDEMKLVEVNFGLQRAMADQEKNKTDQVRCEQEIQSLSENLTRQTHAFQSLEKQFAETHKRLSQLEQENEEVGQELSRQEGILRIHEQDQKQKGLLYHQLAESRQQIVHEYNLMEAKELEHDKNVHRIEDELGESGERKGQIAVGEKEANALLALLEERVHQSAKQYKELEDQGQNVLQYCEKTDLELSIENEALKQIEHDFVQSDLSLAHQRALSQAVIEELSERCNLTMEEALQLPLPLSRSLDQTEKQVKGIRQSMQEIGDVNLSAIEDLEKQEVRFAFLRQQMEDLIQSKGELLAIIQQLDGESRKLFKETFEAIRLNFKKNFQILFSGGEADLQLTDSQDILEAGIEIAAQPPGKQMRSMSLLSGGEKCLTAVALLFAIFEVKPAPFCILDEIDAPLDDANVDRFVNVVKHFANRCQFLIITHNKRTMAIGDILFGVTMEEKGVSKLLSLDFAHSQRVETDLEPAALH